MVLPALLRDPPCNPVKARRRHRDVLVDRDFRLPAMARYVAGAFGTLQAGLQSLLLGLRRDRHWAGISRLAAAGRWLRHRRPHPDRVLFPASPGHHPVAWAF